MLSLHTHIFMKILNRVLNRDITKITRSINSSEQQKVHEKVVGLSILSLIFFGGDKTG